jgi:hypothetical protein
VTTALAFLLIALALGFVAWPFFSSREDEPAGEGAQPATADDRWERQKGEAYSAIKEAEFDLRMGKMSAGDFAALRDKYAARALEAITALEQAKAREKARAPRRSNRIAFCPQCGSEVPARAKFCPGCGEDLRAVTSQVA